LPGEALTAALGALDVATGREESATAAFCPPSRHPARKPRTPHDAPIMNRIAGSYASVTPGRQSGRAAAGRRGTRDAQPRSCALRVPFTATRRWTRQQPMHQRGAIERSCARLDSRLVRGIRVLAALQAGTAERGNPYRGFKAWPAEISRHLESVSGFSAVSAVSVTREADPADVPEFRDNQQQKTPSIVCSGFIVRGACLALSCLGAAFARRGLLSRRGRLL
jgi:hypothetical protein